VPSDDDAGEPSDVDGGRRSDVDAGVDTEYVMNLTFVLTLVVGVPLVVVLSLFVELDGWGEIGTFVVQVGAAIWFLTAIAIYARERFRA
jgi:hypothetical protein